MVQAGGRVTKRGVEGDNVAQLVTAGKPVNAEKIASLETLLAQARTGEVTSFVFVAIGPGFAAWNDGWLANRMDRYTLMGQLTMALRSVQDAEQESEP